MHRLRTSGSRAATPDLHCDVDLLAECAVDRIEQTSLTQELEGFALYVCPRDVRLIPVGGHNGLDEWIGADLPRTLTLRTLVETLRGDGREDLVGAMTALTDQHPKARGQFPELSTIPDTVAHQRLNRIVARAAVRQFGQSAANSSGDTS
jgi:hypothetical protein